MKENMKTDRKRTSRKQMKDGWHIIKGWNVWIEDNKIMHGTDRNHKITVYPYHSTKYGIVNAIGVNVYTFRNSHKYFME